MNIADPLQHVKEPVRKQKLYTLPEIDYDIKVNQNENPFDLPDDLKQKILSAIRERQWNRYPRLGSEELRHRLGTSLGVSGDVLMVGNGSNEVMLAIMNAVLEPGKCLVTIEPTFTLYKHYAEIMGAEVITVPLADDFTFQVDLLKRAVSKFDVALTIVCSPNNPTGTVLEESQLRELLEAGSGFILVDEAYGDFSTQDFLPLLDEYPNLLLTRTFSKAFAFAFGRFGYGIAHPDMAAEIYKVLLPYNLNGFTETAVEILLSEKETMETIIADIIQQRDSLYETLQQFVELEVYPSQANFFLIHPNIDSAWLYNQLMARKILVRDVSYYPGLGNHLRISVGTEEENSRIMDSLRELLSGTTTIVEK
ncbi:MAG TPA: histidinol-phosphate transaminase [bacterium]|nr:histidinol-phosphate transaminase [bacterium]